MLRSDSSPHELLPTTRIGRKDFLAAQVGDKLVLMNVDKGVYIGLDDVGKDIWDRLEVPRTIVSLCDDLQTVYEVSDRLILERDVTEFMRSLRLQGLIEAIP